MHNSDVTYFYIQKPKDFDLQRDTYSSHKKRNLVKVGAITTTDGTFESLTVPMCGSLSDKQVWIRGKQGKQLREIAKSTAKTVLLNVDKGMNIDPKKEQEEEEEEDGEETDEPTVQIEQEQEQEQEQDDNNDNDDDSNDDDREDDSEDGSDGSEDEVEEKEESVKQARENLVDQLKKCSLYQVMEPEKRKGASLTKEEISRARLIASERISIEQAFGRLKNTYKLLQKVIPPTMIPSLLHYIVVACYFCNKYCKGFNHQVKIVQKD